MIGSWTIPYRALLLASVAGAAAGGIAQGQTISSPVSGPVSTTTDTPLVVTGSGSVESNVSPGSAAVIAGVANPSITNNGLIHSGAASGIGLHVTSGGSVGTISNSGTLAASASGGRALVVDAGNNVGTLTNSGTISSSAAAVTVAGTLGAISNSGTILSTAGTGILVSAGGAITNGITNSAGGLIQGATLAIDNSANATKLSILNAGSIVGGIQFGSGADVLAIIGSGTVVGAITGQAGSGASVDFSPSGTYTLNNAITSVDTVNVVSGALEIRQFGTLTTPISGAEALNIASGARVNFNSGTVQAAAFTNSGLLNIRNGSPTIAGNYDQTTTGQLELQLNGTTNHGLLTVTGAANIAGTAGGIVVNAPVASLPGLFGQTVTVVTSSGLTVSTASNLTVTSNDPLIDFTATETGTSLLLTGVLPVDSTLRPAPIAFAQAVLGSIISVNGGATTSVDNRMVALRATTGLSAGDEIGRGFEVWVAPFGSFTTQNPIGGMDGFTSSTYGAALGADTMVLPNLRLGFALGVGNSDIDFTANRTGGFGSITDFQMVVYGTWFKNGFFVDGLFGGGFDWYKTTENFPSLGMIRTSSFNGTQIDSRLGVGYAWKAPNGMTVTPGLSIQDIHYNMDGYTTSGLGPLNLHVNSNSFDVIQGKVGAKVSYPVPLPGGYSLAPEVHAYYVHNFGSTRITDTSSFTGGGPTFSTTSPSYDRNLFNIGLGVTLAQSGPASLGVAYDFTGGATSHEHLVLFRFKYNF